MPAITFPGFGSGHTYNKTLTSTPVQAGSVVLELASGGGPLGTDDGSGHLTGSGITGGTINYTSGAVAWTDSNDYTSVNLKLTWTVATVLPISRKPLGGFGTQFIPNRGGVPIGSAFQPNPYGVDIKCFDDLDPYFPLVGGIDVLAQDLYHLITSAPGTIPGAPDLGFDSRFLLNQSITQQELAAIQSNMKTTLESDERVQQALVTLSYANGNLTITAAIIPLNPQYSRQPFQFVASVTAIGSNLLSISPQVS